MLLYLCDECLKRGRKVEATHNYFPIDQPANQRRKIDVCNKHLTKAEVEGEKCFRIGKD